MMRLYGYRNGRTLRALWVLEEVGAEYEFVEVDVTKGEGQAEWFLKINPFGKVPVLVDGDVVISESAAICQHVAETYPAAALLPPPATADSAHCHQWISFLLPKWTRRCGPSPNTASRYPRSSVCRPWWIRRCGSCNARCACSTTRCSGASFWQGTG